MLWLLALSGGFSRGQDFAFVTLEAPASRSIVLSHPLLSGDSPAGAFPNRVEDILPGQQEGTHLRKLGPNGTWQTNLFTHGAWSDPNMALLPGEAAIFVSPAATLIDFAGIVPTGVVRTYIREGRSLIAAPIPLEGRAFSDLGLPLVEGLAIHTLATSGVWVLQGQIQNGHWSGQAPEPTFGVAEGFMVDSPRSFFWEIQRPPEPPISSIDFSSTPTDQVLTLGQPLTLEARVTNPAGLAFQWQHNGTHVPGATTPVFHVPRTTTADAGDYWLLVYGTDRYQLSPMARVIIEAPPLVLSLQPTPDPHRLQITLTGVLDEIVALERSTNLRDWEVERASITLPATLAIENPVGGPGSRYYRARRP